MHAGRGRLTPPTPVQNRQSGDGRSVDPFRSAAARGVVQDRECETSRTDKAERESWLAGNCDHGKQAATIRRLTFAFVVCLLVRPAAIGMMVGHAIGVDMHVGAVMRGSRETMIFGEAMSGGIGVGQREGERRRNDAEAVKQGRRDGRFDAQGFFQCRQHRVFRSKPSAAPQGPQRGPAQSYNGNATLQLFFGVPEPPLEAEPAPIDSMVAWLARVIACDETANRRRAQCSTSKSAADKGKRDRECE
jgi:hypothetical protein